MPYEAIIGMEVHAQLQTGSKMFCSCRAVFGAEPNTHCCPVCLGLPGVLPVANKAAIESVLKTALALHCEIQRHCRFARKNYYYPDLPKNYQISQYEEPLSRDGYLEIDVNGTTKRVGIRRVHLEEDTGKSLHAPDGTSLQDYNRCGVPLMEIVTEPDMNSPAEARAYLLALQTVLRYIGVSSASPEQGAMRCEPTVNIRDTATGETTGLVELKNLNSFRAVHDGIAHEVERQQKALAEGVELPERETRRWNAERGITTAMRHKESSEEYRYFPEPDLVPMAVGEEWVEEVRAELPELSRSRRARLAEQYGIPDYDAGVLTASREIADFFEECAGLHSDAKAVANWVMVDLMGKLNEAGSSLTESKVTPAHLARMLDMIARGTISGKIGKQVFEEMFETGKAPEAICEEKSLTLISDGGEIDGIVDEVLSENEKIVADFVGGKDQAAGALMGQIMRKTQGKVDPQLANKALRERLAEVRDEAGSG
ncbi:MAG: Asp-tRNA(Asn)/Glu-tRNA(Gln) amidotransferase subunit GatB [Armatimonadota bacterium]